MSPLTGGREREITQGGTWDELPCERGEETGEGGAKISSSLLNQGGHGMSSHVPPLGGHGINSHAPPNKGRGNIKPLPLNQREGTCTCHYDEWAHTAPPIYNRGRGFMLPLPLLGGHRSLSHAPLRGEMGAHPMSPQLRREGLIFAPPSPVSHSLPPWVISHTPPPSHMGAHPMFLPWLSPALFPPSRGDMGAHPVFPRGPVKGRHGSPSHVPRG